MLHIIQKCNRRSMFVLNRYYINITRRTSEPRAHVDGENIMMFCCSLQTICAGFWGAELYRSAAAAAAAAHVAPRFRVIRKKNYRKYRKNVFEKPPVSPIHIISLSEYTSHAHDYIYIIHDRSPSPPKKGTSVSPFADTIPIVETTTVHAASHLHH